MYAARITCCSAPRQSYVKDGLFIHASSLDSSVLVLGHKRLMTSKEFTNRVEEYILNDAYNHGLDKSFEIEFNWCGMRYG